MTRFIFNKIVLILILSFCWVVPARAQVVLPDFVSLSQKAMPSFVNIYTKEILDEVVYGSNNSASFKPSGSGFIADENGYIITNLHVIKNATQIEVIAFDENIYEAKIVGSDEATDIAILKIETKDKLYPAIFGNSDEVLVGQWVMAIGNPFGLGSSVSKGIVSAISRKISDNQYDEFIQTDVQINQGNSGGPLFDTNGELVGVNCLLFSETGKNMGISFAVPSNIAKWVLDDIKSQYESGVQKPIIKRGYLGIKFQKAKNSNDIIISGFRENSIAKTSKLKAGDVVVKFNNQDIKDLRQLNRLIYQSKIGSKISITKLINTKQETVDLLVQDDVVIEKKTVVLENNISELGLGLELEEIDGSVVVKSVDIASDAQNKGIKKGSVIVKIDKKDIVKISDVKKCIDEAKLENKRPIILLIQNGEELNFATLRTDK